MPPSRGQGGPTENQCSQAALPISPALTVDAKNVLESHSCHPPCGICNTRTFLLPLKLLTSDCQHRGSTWNPFQLMPFPLTWPMCEVGGRGGCPHRAVWLPPDTLQLGVKVCSRSRPAQAPAHPPALPCVASTLAFPSAPSSTPSSSKTISEDTETPPDGCLCFWLSSLRSLQCTGGRRLLGLPVPGGGRGAGALGTAAHPQLCTCEAQSLRAGTTPALPQAQGKDPRPSAARFPRTSCGNACRLADWGSTGLSLTSPPRPPPPGVRSRVLSLP